MTLWFIFALMAACVGTIVLVALRPGAPGRVSDTSDLTVYREQLVALDADLDSGRIEEPEADVARIEISRRLLAAGRSGNGDSASGSGYRAGSGLPVTLAILVVLFSLGLYTISGNPDLPGMPFAERTNLQDQSVPELLARIEAHLQESPDDGQGWDLLAPIYLRMGRFDEAVRAFSNAGRLLGASAPRLAGLGEALVEVNSGTIVQPARDALAGAIALDPALLRPRFLLTMALEQDGRLVDARTAWLGLLGESPEDAPWRDAVMARLTALEGRMADNAGPDQGDIDAARQMSPADRQQMVRQLVAQLSTRLTADGGPVSDWLRLVRSYAVLQQPDAAREALAGARAQFGGDATAMDQIAALARSLGLEE